LTFSESFILDEFYKVTHEYEFTWLIGVLWGSFAVTLVIFTSIAPFFIKRCSASMFNISLVSQIFWSYIVEVVFGESAPKGYEYYIGFVVIIIGIFIFNKFPVTTLTDEYHSNKFTDQKDLTRNLIIKKNSLYINDNISETSACSAFSAERKYTYYKNPTLSAKANKYLNINHY
jgi:hypothetical protein